jgi:hypothetical protein
MKAYPRILAEQIQQISQNREWFRARRKRVI